MAYSPFPNRGKSGLLVSSNYARKFLLDCQFYGLNPGGHHFRIAMLHMVTAILLFLLLRQTAAALLRSPFVAAAFAIHPLRWNRWHGWWSAGMC